MAMAESSSKKQCSLCELSRSTSFGSESEDEFDLLLDALSTIDNKLLSIETNTRQCEDEIHTVVRRDSAVVSVYLQISISSVEDVDTLRQEFTCHFYLGVMWEEPQLKGYVRVGSKIEWDKCWNPRIHFQNAVEILSMTSSSRLIQPLYDGNPNVQISYRVKGKFKTLFDLRNFPFDTQRLQIRIVSKWGDSVVQLKEASHKPGYLCCKAFLCKHEWDLYKHVIGTESCTADDCTNDHSLNNCTNTSSVMHCRHRAASSNKPSSPAELGAMQKTMSEERPLTFSVFTFSFSIRRKFSFFMSNVVLLLSLISFLALGPFCVPQTEIGDRMSIIFTLLLTAVTFKFVVSQSLPRVPYQTLLDQYVLACIIYIFAMSVIIGVTTKIKFLQKHEPFTIIVSFCLWFFIMSWIAFTSMFTVKNSNIEIQRLDNIFNSISTQSTVFQHLAEAEVKDIILPKFPPNIVPLRISESTASSALPQQSLSNAAIDRSSGLVTIHDRSRERSLTLAKIRLKKKNLKNIQGRERGRKKPKSARVISDDTRTRKSLPAVNASNALLSTSSSSEAADGGEIVLMRYAASSSCGPDHISDDEISAEGDVFPQKWSENKTADDLNEESREAACIRSLASQG